MKIYSHFSVSRLENAHQTHSTFLNTFLFEKCLKKKKTDVNKLLALIWKIFDSTGF